MVCKTRIFAIAWSTMANDNKLGSPFKRPFINSCLQEETIGEKEYEKSSLRCVDKINFIKVVAV